jgi:hypothetical protein
MAGDAHGFDRSGAQRVVEAVRWVERQRKSVARRPHIFKPGQVPPQWIPIVNDSGEEMPAFGIGYVVAVEREEPFAVRVDKIGSEFKREFLINNGLPLPAGELGFAQRGVYQHVLYDESQGSPDPGDSFGPKANSWKVHRNYPEVAICQVVANAGDAVMLARIKDLDRIHFQIEDDIAKNASGTGKIMQRESGGSYSQIANWTATVHNYYGALTADSSTKADGFAIWNQGHWEIVAAECL